MTYWRLHARDMLELIDERLNGFDIDRKPERELAPDVVGLFEMTKVKIGLQCGSC